MSFGFGEKIQTERREGRERGQMEWEIDFLKRFSRFTLKIGHALKIICIRTTPYTLTPTNSFTTLFMNTIRIGLTAKI